MGDSYKTIAVFEYSYQAQILKGRLEADGINVFLGDLYSVEAEPGASQAMGGIKVKVRSEDVIKAKRIKEEIDNYEDIDPINCPNCNSEFVTLDTDAQDLKSVLKNLRHFFINVFLNESKLQYHCTNCGEKFIK